MNWNDYKIAFKSDSSWRDIYVLETELKDWKTLLEFFAEGRFPFRFLVNDIEQPISTNAWQIFQDKKQEKFSLMLVDIAGVTLACHFFEQNEIEFDFDPREVSDEKRAEAVLNFMKQIGDELDKTVILTEENAQDDIWFSYDPTTGEISEYELFK